MLMWCTSSTVNMIRMNKSIHQWFALIVLIPQIRCNLHCRFWTTANGGLLLVTIYLCGMHNETAIDVNPQNYGNHFILQLELCTAPFTKPLIKICQTVGKSEHRSCSSFVHPFTKLCQFISIAAALLSPISNLLTFRRTLLNPI